MGRIRDALTVLRGRSEAQAELARIRAQWTDILCDVTGALEKMNAMNARLAKRESRMLAAQAPVEPTEAQEDPVSSVTSRKSHLYKRARELRGKGVSA